MKKLFILFAVVTYIASCSEKDKIPHDILPKEKMQAVLWSMISAGEYLDGYLLRKDSADKTVVSAKVYSQVFQVYHITKESFDKSYRYYRDHPELMKIILDSLHRKQVDPVGSQPWDTARKKLMEKDAVQ